VRNRRWISLRGCCGGRRCRCGRCIGGRDGGAAAVIVLAGAGLGYRQYRGEMAKEQVMQAFKITSVKVNRIQSAVEGVGK